jgi:hypothetical protein
VRLSCGFAHQQKDAVSQFVNAMMLASKGTFSEQKELEKTSGND